MRGFEPECIVLIAGGFDRLFHHFIFDESFWVTRQRIDFRPAAKLKCIRASAEPAKSVMRHKDKETVKREVERVVPPLLESGGYIPLLDGRVREYIPCENYEYYRELLQEIVSNKM